MEDYKAILPYVKKKAQGTVAIFQRRDSRELFNEDARLVADQLLMSDVGVRTYFLDNAELTVLSLNKVQLNRVIRDLLLVLRCRVEIYEEDISGKGFEVTAKGDLTHYDDFKDIVEGCVELSELSTLMAVRMYSDNMKGEEENKITAVFCNPHDMRITVAEFADTPNFSHLSECIQIMVPRQCLLFKGDRDANMKAFIQLETALRRPNLPYTVIDYSPKDMDKIKEEFVASATGLDSIKLDTGNGFFFRAPLREEKAITRQKYEIVDIKRSYGVIFVTKELKSVSAESAGVMKKYNELQKQLTQKVVEIAVKQAGNLQGLNDIIALIDVLVAFSTISIESSGGYIRPELLEAGTGVFDLKECRHPVIELKDDMEYIPNDIELSYESKDGKVSGPRFAVITGANMGGKSTYLRSAGLSVIMGQMGCFVPCESARFSIIDGIYTRVGASDYQCSGVSTFMAEMMDCVAILDAAKPTSLVLVDELGRGTSTYDGFSLAWGVADHILNKIGCFCLFATHYHEMSLLKEKFPNDVVNLKVDTFTGKDGEITFLYKIVEGLAERSFGLNIANTLKFPEKIMIDAKKILNFLETNSWENADEIDPLLNEKAQAVKEEELNELIKKIKEEVGKISDPGEMKKKILEMTRLVA
ncbi:hypothetical protein FO519_005980 [Halicephalobus sp. NKZ332]|nr:hypothetical protein FO519_005980 [Halicephalobus sp. NKZ332]